MKYRDGAELHKRRKSPELFVKAGLAGKTLRTSRRDGWRCRQCCSIEVFFTEGGVMVEYGVPSQSFGSPENERTRLFLRRARGTLAVVSHLIQKGNFMTISTIDPVAQRRAAVAALLDDARRIVTSLGVTRAALDALSERLQALSRDHGSLFNAEDFPPPQPGSGDTSTRYRLNPGEDGIALYLNSLLPGKTTIPHNHDTWAVIAALKGQELNRLYKRTDDRSDPERAALETTGEVVVKPGTPIAFLPEDIHSIHVTGSAPTLHFHLYGRPLDTLTGRLGFETETGKIVRYNAAHMQRGTQAVG
jgi:predicted metal-dependent enzyme (double-stranded beta helix superfamily)